MRRREFITLIGRAAVAWPTAALAQKPVKQQRVAVVHATAPITDMSESGGPIYRPFFQELRRLGYVEGQNLVVERYSGEGRTAHYAELAAEIVRAKPDLIFTTGPMMLTFKVATDTIPIVGAIGDPVAYGLVESLARPGGNVTGVSVDAGLEVWGKRLQILKEIIPGLSRVAFLAPTQEHWESPNGPAVREASERLGISVIVSPLEGDLGDAKYRHVFELMAQERADALIVNPSPENFTYRRLIVELSEKARLPTLYGARYYMELGGLIAYAYDSVDAFRRLAGYVDQILKGRKPADLPFYQSNYLLIINLKTANALGLKIPTSLLATADEVIE
jgi:putative ABC transport system substrate-binding protein